MQVLPTCRKHCRIARSIVELLWCASTAIEPLAQVVDLVNRQRRYVGKLLGNGAVVRPPPVPAARPPGRRFRAVAATAAGADSGRAPPSCRSRADADTARCRPCDRRPAARCRCCHRRWNRSRTDADAGRAPGPAACRPPRRLSPQPRLPPTPAARPGPAACRPPRQLSPQPRLLPIPARPPRRYCREHRIGCIGRSAHAHNASTFI